MKTLGLIGGLTWHSTVHYYRIINETVHQRLGGHHAARMILYSVNFAEFLPPDDPEGWRDIGRRLIEIAQRLEQSGADGLVLCANTPHKLGPEITAAIGIPLIHIAEVTAGAIQSRRLDRVGLLGTRYTMEESFYSDKLRAAGIETIIPESADREFLHRSIFDELGQGIFLPATRERYARIINNIVGKGAQGVILGCTEIPLIVKPEDFPLPLFDTTLLHATAAAEFALAD
jgi:aspartate racemase